MIPRPAALTGGRVWRVVRCGVAAVDAQKVSGFSAVHFSTLLEEKLTYKVPYTSAILVRQTDVWKLT